MSTKFVEKLTKQEINQLLKTVLGANFRVDAVRVHQDEISNQTRLVSGEPWANTKVLYEVWSKLETDKLTVYAWDHSCFWQVAIELTDYSIFIPKYKNGFSQTGNSEFYQTAYLKEMAKLFGKNYLSDVYKTKSKYNPFQEEEKIWNKPLSKQEKEFLDSFKLDDGGKKE